MTRQMHVSLLLLLLLFLFVQLCSTSGILAEPSTKVVLELPQQGESASRAYTVATKNRKFIRINASTLDLKEGEYCTEKVTLIKNLKGEKYACEAVDFFTDEMISSFVETIIPAAIKLHADRLLVDPESGPLIVPEFNETSVCSKFTVPTEHHSKGVENTDMVLYVAARPVNNIHEICARNDAGRPIAGAINILPFRTNSQRYYVRVMAHGIAHVLGFDYNVFKNNSMVVESNFEKGGKRVLVNSSKTVKKVQEHYGCNTAQGMELEYERWGEVGAVSSHWNYRVAKDDLMSSRFTVGGMYYTALTMSVFDGLPYYSVNWDMAEPMAWGNKSNCDLLDNNFDKVTFIEKYPKMFCKSDGSYSCTTDRSALGVCDPSEYYRDSTFNEIRAVFVRGRSDNSGTSGTLLCFAENTIEMEGSVVGNDSFCLDTDEYTISGRTGKSTGVCARVRCEGNEVEVMYAGSKEWHKCPENSTLNVSSTPFVSKKITCPKYSEVCTVAPNGSSLRPMVYPSWYEETTTAPNTGEEGSTQKPNETGGAESGSTNSSSDSRPSQDDQKAHDTTGAEKASSEDAGASSSSSSSSSSTSSLPSRSRRNSETDVAVPPTTEGKINEDNVTSSQVPGELSIHVGMDGAPAAACVLHALFLLMAAAAAALAVPL
ncbi:surface protease GP63 [Trypanosoma theileri]|uniref:Leishmanolysin-like peptidase n=1 Tax=Trypanosoma theileri TaxID=67003 RepID=A0A1X0NEX7_9TRYP|nr:surface protease GP63 [Trypanosoma theileri]ORC82660.1 surface protease GP63 [Trypanosoma theileri]